MISDEEIKDLEEKAKQVRKDIMVQLVGAGGGHAGPSLSIVEICVALYFYHAKLDPKNPEWEERDRIVLSKAHACETVYSCLARLGFFSPDILPTYKHFGSMLQGHPANTRTPGVEVSTGSLGQGLSFGIGVALAGKLDNRDYNVYVLIGDGESEEGQVWEAAASASYHKLDNLAVLLDRNMLQIDGCTEDIVALESIRERWKAFGWHVIEIDGHNMSQILEALHKADEYKGKPTMIIMSTIKGTGVSFMENTHKWHYRAASEEETKRALEELEVV